MSKFRGDWNDSMSAALKVPAKYRKPFDALTVDGDNEGAIAAGRKIVAEWEPAVSRDKWDERGITHLGIEHAPMRFPAKGLLLYGPTGTGKSTILGAVAVELERKGIPHLWIYWVQLLDLVAGAHDTTDAQDAIATCAALFVDEFAELEPGEKVAGRLRELFERRYGQGLPILASTNLDGAAQVQARLGVAVASRLRETTDFVLGGKVDRRRARAAPGGGLA